mmetsp:Transcript_28808/g.52680  ORF Transcript_28808/g.52680 Transcript_28808/m.52680 type:complete len:132 (+) Transcript_28808:836-1231(+)|eukprot:CAMPEP_0201601678 /NCGR_PEP_ID=MMETSP0492-20130828/2602_1 /ASSEMBLY_ACC=CAM_ASM_000837 /TAXON_ID=420259 /ORGANISM="Thalassiosira gravida, Strain GMp14c1" /LENGTH=131 /DNA_ID=CAMNT_0048064983 /DNA_START=578 /DNA_END=973 /DNA_ORIENTATION=-
MECHGKEEGHCEPSSTSVTWECIVCGKINREEEKTVSLCIICGRHKGYSGSKQTRVLNRCPLDTTPHATAATKDELGKAKLVEKRRVRWEGYEGKKSFFLSSGDDYEAIERTDMKEEASRIIAAIRTTLEN